MKFEKEWREVFLAPAEGQDAFTVFAEKIGKTREEAQEICWAVMHQAGTPWVVERILRLWNEDVRELSAKIKALEEVK